MFRFLRDNIGLIIKTFITFIIVVIIDILLDNINKKSYENGEEQLYQEVYDTVEVDFLDTILVQIN